MKLNRKNISDSAFWKQNGIKLPTFDIDAVRANTEIRYGCISAREIFLKPFLHGFIKRF